VVFSEDLPKTAYNHILKESIKNCFDVVTSNELPMWILSKGYNHLKFSDNIPHLRFYHISKINEQVIMFFNDDCLKTIQTELVMPFESKYVLYDAWTGKVIEGTVVNNKIHIEIKPQSTIFAVFSNDFEACEKQLSVVEIRDLNSKYDICIHDTYNDEKREYAKNSKLINISSPEHLPYFCGKIQYKTCFNIELLNGRKIMIDLGIVGETAEVILNGEKCGLRIQSPYVFDITEFVKQGNNQLEILVANNPAYYERDIFSTKLALSPSGLLGPIKILIGD